MENNMENKMETAMLWAWKGISREPLETAISGFRKVQLKVAGRRILIFWGFVRET